MDLNYFALVAAQEIMPFFKSRNSGTNGQQFLRRRFNFPLRSGYAASKHAIKDI
jgi:hypothetical protein